MKADLRQERSLRRAFEVERLEPRVLLSGAPMAEPEMTDASIPAANAPAAVEVFWEGATPAPLEASLAVGSAAVDDVFGSGGSDILAELGVPFETPEAQEDDTGEAVATSPASEPNPAESLRVTEETTLAAPSTDAPIPPPTPFTGCYRFSCALSSSFTGSGGRPASEPLEVVALASARPTPGGSTVA